MNGVSLPHLSLPLLACLFCKRTSKVDKKTALFQRSHSWVRTRKPTQNVGIYPLAKGTQAVVEPTLP